jgi:tripartite-type tricarboxylate transporter receptor subunit TctC
MAALRLVPPAIGVALLAANVDVCAQTYPDRLARYIVPGSPGSGADVLARIVAGGLSQLSGQQVVVENRTGAGGNIGAEIAAKAPADGYTLLQISMTHALNVTLYKKLGYDLMRDFVPVTQLATSPSMLVVHPSLPVKTVVDLIKLAKARPGALNYASAGTGTPTFLAAELFKGQAGIDMVHVPYKGGGEAMTSVISGETSVYFASAGIVLPFVKQGSLRALAVTTPQRLPFLPQLPTVAESGLPRYQSGNWYGLMAPAKTPKEMIVRIRDGTVAALNEASVKKRLTDIAYVPIGDRPEEFAAFVKAEIGDLGKLVQQFRLTAD